MATRLCDIKPRDSDLTIRATVCRLWRGKMLMNLERNDGLQCNNAIHGVVSEADYEDVADKIKLGLIYEITNFNASDNQTNYIVVPHRAKLMFNNRTNFNQLDEVYPPYPRYWFQFVEYNLLHKRKGIDRILSDVIGRVDSVHPIEDVTMLDRVAPKRSIDIKDLRGEKLTVYLWGTMALEFDVSAIEKALYPVVIVFTSTKVRSFDAKTNVSSGMSTCIFVNPSIPETEEYKRRFVGPAYAPKFITDAPRRKQRPPIDISSVDMISIKSLNMKSIYAERNKQKSENKGKITKIMCQQDWYYMGCPRCLKQMKYRDNSSTLYCFIHEDITAEPMYKLQVRVEDKSDSITLMEIGKGGEYLFDISCLKVVNEEGQKDKNSPPASLMKLMGKTKILEVVYGSRNDFVIKSVHNVDDEMEDQPSNLATPEKTASKRTFRNRNDMNVIELSQQEITKKQKSQGQQLKKLKLKQVEQEDECIGEQDSSKEAADKPNSEEDEDCTLSLFFNQQLSQKKTSGQTAKALMIGKKASEQATKPETTAKKESARLKNKNKAKME